MLTTLNVAAQQQRRNPRLDSLKNEKDQSVLQQKLKGLEIGSEADMSLLMQYYYSTESAKALTVGDNILKRYPKGDYAFIQVQNAIFTERSASKQEAMYLDAKKNFPSADLNRVANQVSYTYVTEKNTVKALQYLAEVKDASYRPAVVQSIVEVMMSYDLKNAELLLGKEVENARKLMDNATVTEVAGGRAADPKRNYYTYLNLYGAVLMQNGKEQEAFKYIKDVYAHINQKDDALVKNYAYLLALNGNNEEALPLLEKIVRQGKGDHKIKEALRKAYSKVNPGNDVTTYLASLEGELKSIIQGEVAKLLISETAPSFVVKDVNGKTVSLADFKGKTIVLDFWATWCGPCKKSFPAMQMAVNKYKNDPNVKFLFIHTWERVADPLTDARTYLSSNNYKFDLYMDTKDALTKDNPAVSLFGVSGIPAKFVIDGNGKTRFKITGFSGGNEAAVEELTAMIETAKKKDKI